MGCAKRMKICLRIAGLGLLLSSACGGENSQRGEAQALLERISALDLKAVPAERARRIERLRALPLTDAGLARARDRCVLAHTGLLSAELEQALARQRLDAAAGRGTPVAKGELDAIAASVAHASQSLREAQAALPECEQSTRALAVRYR